MRNIYDIISEHKSLVDINIASYELAYVAEEFEYVQEGIGESLKNLWEKIKKWFKTVLDKIKSFFTNTKKSVGNISSSQLKQAVQQNEKLKNETVTITIYKPIQQALTSVKKILQDLKTGGMQNDSNKEKVLNSVNGLKDKSREGLISMVKDCIIEKENAEIKIQNLNLSIYSEYTTRDKDVIDTIKKEENSISLLFYKEMDKIESTERKNIFEYTISLIMAVTQAFVNFITVAVKNSAQLVNKIAKSTTVVDDKNLDGMVKDFMREIDRNDIEGIRRRLIILIQNDPTFEKNYLNDALKFLNMDDLIFEKNNEQIPLVSSKKTSNYTDDDYVDAIYNLEQNFSKEKVNDAKRIGKATH